MTQVRKPPSGELAEDNLNIEEMYRRYYPGLLRYAAQFVGDEEDAKDIVHDVFAKLLDKPTIYDPRKAAFSTWIYRVARNRAISWLRAARRLETYVEEDSDDSNQENRARTRVENTELCPADPARVFWQEVREKARKDRLPLYLDSLTEQQREWLLMYFTECPSSLEISKRLGANERTVRRVIERAKKVIRRKFDLADTAFRHGPSAD